MFRLAFILALFPLSALAEEMGTIDADLGGEAKTWYTITLGGNSTDDSSATFDDEGGFAMLHLQGHPGDRFTTNDVISVDLMWMGTFSAEKAPISVEFLYMPNGMTGPFWTSEDAPQPATADFDVVVEGDPKVTGTFSGMLCFKEGITTPVDTANCKPFSGTVDSTLAVQ